MPFPPSEDPIPGVEGRRGLVRHDDPPRGGEVRIVLAEPRIAVVAGIEAGVFGMTSPDRDQIVDGGTNIAKRV